MMSYGRCWTIASLLIAVWLGGSGCMVPDKDYVSQALRGQNGSQEQRRDSLQARKARAEFLSSLNQEKLTKKGLKVLWRHNLGQVSERASNLWHTYRSGDKFVVETLDGLIFYFNAQSGVWEGTTALESGLWEKPIIKGEKMYALNGQGLLTIDLPTGSIDDRAPVALPVMAAPVYRNGTLILGGGNGKVLRYRMEDDGLLWKTTALGQIRSPIIASDRAIYVSGYMGQVMAIDPSTGESLWTFKPAVPSDLTSGPALVGDKLYVGGKRGYVYVVSAPDGILLSKFPCGAPVSKSPVGIGDKLLVFPYKSGVQCLNAGEKLSMQWRHGDATELVSRGTGGLYMLTRDERMACLDEATGEEKWSMKMPQGLLVASDPGQAAFYLASPEGQIVAVGELDQVRVQ